MKRHYPELWLGLIIWYVVVHGHFGNQGQADTCSSYCIVIILAVVLYLVLRAENKRRESLRLDEEERDRLAFQDLTDIENRYFQYVL